MNKNEVIEIAITDITDNGSGVGRKDNMVIFVPKTAVGDTVKARIIKITKNYCIGKLEATVIPSNARITPDCECFSKCGGCSFRG